MEENAARCTEVKMAAVGAQRWRGWDLRSRAPQKPEGVKGRGIDGSCARRWMAQSLQETAAAREFVSDRACKL